MRTGSNDRPPFRTSMTTSKQPLSDVERRLLVDGFDRLKDHPGRALAEIIYRTGIHPIALSEPDRFNLHSDGENLRWTRPKNRASMSVPLDPILKSWFAEWWKAYRAYDVRHIHRLIKRFGEACHIHGLGPRPLRHTFLWRMAQVYPPDEVARKGGCTVQVAIEYARMARTDTDEGIASGRLPP